MAYGDARERKWRGNWWMEWVASTLHTTSEHGVSSTTTADAHTSAASSRLNWRPRRFKWTRPFRRKTKSVICHHISAGLYLENILSPCHFVQHKSYMNWPGIEPKPLQWQAMNQLPEPVHGQIFNINHICISCCMLFKVTSPCLFC
jgi:hypothetical protein